MIVSAVDENDSSVVIRAFYVFCVRSVRSRRGDSVWQDGFHPSFPYTDSSSQRKTFRNTAETTSPRHRPTAVIMYAMFFGTSCGSRGRERSTWDTARKRSTQRSKNSAYKSLGSQGQGFSNSSSAVIFAVALFLVDVLVGGLVAAGKVQTAKKDICSLTHTDT